MTRLITTEKQRTKLIDALTDAADEFAQIAAGTSNLALSDKWAAEAENLRQIASLTHRDQCTVSVAEAFVAAAQKKLRAEERAVHESRAARREGANQ